MHHTYGQLGTAAGCVLPNSNDVLIIACMAMGLVYPDRHALVRLTWFCQVSECHVANAVVVVRSLSQMPSCLWHACCMVVNTPVAQQTVYVLLNTMRLHHSRDAMWNQAAGLLCNVAVLDAPLNASAAVCALKVQDECTSFWQSSPI